MKLRRLLLLIVIIFFGCSQRNNHILVAGIELIPVVLNKVTRDTPSFIEKIEIIPLKPTTPLSFMKSKGLKYKADYPEHFSKTITIYCNAKGCSPFQLKVIGNAE